MADARYVIDIILNARDNTGAAFAEAIGNAKALERITKDQERQNKETERSYKDMTRELGTSQSTLNRLMAQVAAGSKDAAEEMVKLENATRGYVQAVDQHGQKSAQAVVALDKLRESEEKLTKELVARGDEHGRLRAQEIVLSAKAQEQVKKETASYVQAAKIRAAADREAARERAEQNRTFLAEARTRLQAIQNTNREEIKEHNDKLDTQIANEKKATATFLEESRKRLAAIKNTNREEIKEHNDKLDAQEAAEAEAQKKYMEGARLRLRQIQNTNKDELAAHEARRKAQDRELTLGKRYLDQLQKVVNLEKQRAQAAKVGDTVQVQLIKLEDKEARRQAEATAAEIRKILSNIEANVDLDSAEAIAHAAATKAALEAAIGDLEVKVDVDARRAINSLKTLDGESRNTTSGMGLLVGAIGSVGEKFRDSSQAVASFDNFLRGLMSLGIAVFLNQIVLLAGAAASAFMGLASSAAFAGAAIGGSLVAGIAQALGPLGILLATMQRFGAVTDAVKQSNLLQQQESYKGAEASKQQAAATDRVTGAQERVADSGRRVAEAQRGIREAQEGVNEARVEAARKLEDLILAERGLNLSMEENEEAIRKATQAGQTGALPRLFLRRDELKQDLGRTREDIGERQAGRAPEVEQAQKGVRAATEALKDAQRAAKDASRDVKRAQADAVTAGAGITAAAGKLNYLLGQLSGAERKLYDAIKRLQNVWREFSQTITAPMILAFVDAIDRIIEILKDKRIVKAATDMSEEMAKQFKRIFKAFTDEEAIQQLLRIMDQAKTNLKPLTDIAINIGKAFLDIAEAAGPALSEIIDWVRDISIDIRKFFESAKGKRDLEEFFTEGVKHLKAWGGLLWAVIRLFAAIAGPGGGAKSGLKLVQDLGKTIEGWADQIEKPGTKLNEFFNRFFELGRQMLDVFGPVFEALASEFDKTFSGDGLKAVEGFATFLKDVLIPALFDFMRLLGLITGKAGEFAEEHPEITKIAAAFLAATLSLGIFFKLLAIFRPLLAPFEYLFKHLKDIKKAFGLVDDAAKGARKWIDDFAKAIGKIKIPGFGQLGTAIGRIIPMFTRFAAALAGPWGLIIGLVVLLLDKFDLLDDAWDAIKGGFMAMWDQIEPPLKRLVDSFKDFWAVVQEGNGPLGLLLDVLKPVMEILIKIGGVVLEEIGKAFGQVIGGIIDIIGGFIDIITGLLSGDFGKVWEGVKDIVRGALNFIIGFVTLVFFRGLGAAFKVGFRGLLTIGREFIGGFWGVIKGIGGFFIRAFRSGWETAWGFLKTLPTRLLNLGKDIVVGFWNGFKSFAGTVKRGIEEAWNFVKGLPKRWWELAKDIVNAYFRGYSRIGRVIKEVIEDVWGWIKRLPSRFWNLAKDIVTRFWNGYMAIGRFIRKAVEDAWNWLKGLPGRFWDLAKRVAARWWDGIKNIGQALRNAIEDGWAWVKALPDRLWNIAKDAATNFVKAFKNIGNAILGAIFEGAKSTGEFAKNIVNGVFDLLNKGWDKTLGGETIGIKGVASFTVPQLNLKLAEGGLIPGFGGGDRVPAMLEPGEHVLTKEEVRAAGGHAVIFALRAMLGGGTQGGPFGYRLGGVGTGGPTDPRLGMFGPSSLPRGGTPLEKTPEEVDHEREEYKKSGEQRAKDWRTMWNDMLTTARRSANDIEKQIRDMRVNTTATLRRMRRDTEKILDDITKSFNRHGSAYSKSWAATMDSLKKVTYDGLTYIGHETNKALKALDIDAIHFGLTAPSKSDTGGTGSDPGNNTGGGLPTAAHGGIIGTRGERGRDRVATLLGRGEAVLNYAHQAYVEPALHAFYGHGLNETFRRVRGYHAGGQGAPGFAAGGQIDVMGSKPGFAMLMKFFRRRFRDPDLAVMSGFRGGAIVAGTNRTSNHASGDAIDITNPESRGHSESNPPPTSSLDRLFPFLLRWPQPPRRDTLWRTTQGGNHYDHVHLGMDPSVTGSLAAARAFLKDIPGGDFVSEVKRQIVKGIGPLREMVQKILDKVRKAANDKIDEEFGAVDATDGGHVEIGPGGPAEKIFNFFKGHGLSDAIAAGFVGVFKKESGFSTTVPNAEGSGATGLAQWLGGRLANLKAFASSRGVPWDALQTQLDFVWHELQGDESAALAQILQAKSPAEAARIIDSAYERPGPGGLLNAPAYAEEAFDAFAPGGGYAQGGFAGEYARGGQLPGPEGRPVPIVAHAGEWILNKGQQGRMASFLGTSVGKLRDALGFTGGPTSFKGGGEAKFVPRLEAQLKAAGKGDYTLPVIPDADVENLAREFRTFEIAIDALWDGITKVQLNVKKLNEKALRGKLVGAIGKFSKGVGEFTKDQGLFDLMATALENLGTRMQTNLDLAQVGLKRVGVKVKERLRPGGELVKVEHGTRLQARDPLIDEAVIARRTMENLDRLYEGLPKRRAKAEERMKRVDAQLRRLRKGDEDAGQQREIGRLVDTRQKLQSLIDQSSGLRDLRTTTQNMLGSINAAIKRLGRPKTKAQEDLYLKLVSDRINTQAKLDDVDEKILANRQAREEARIQRFQAVTQRLLKGPQRAAARLERRLGIAQAFGQEEAAAGIQQQMVGNLQDQQAVIRQRLEEARRPSGKKTTAAQKKRNAALIEELEEQSRSIDVAIAQAVAAAQQAAVEAINNRYGREQAKNAIGQRLASLFGRDETNFVQHSMNLMAGNIAELQAQLPGIMATGNTGLLNTVTSQIEELQASIQEGTVQMFQIAREQIERQGARRTFYTELAGRVIDLQERAGDRLGAARNRFGQSDRRIGDLQSDRADAIRIRDAALAAGFAWDSQTVEELTDKIADLDQTIAEENLTRQELTFQYRSLVAEIIAGRTERTTGLIGTASGIFQQLGNLAGVVNQPVIVALLKQVGDTLRGAAQEILQNVREGAGEFGPQGASILTQLANAFAAGPESFATKLAELSPAIAAFGDTLSGPALAAWNALIDSMSNNTIATLDNNIALRDATGAISQSFASEFWKLMRVPIFTGSGRILPQYDIPQMHNGGMIGTSGLYRLAAGERVLNVGDTKRTGKGDETHVHLHNVTQEVDVGHVFEVAEWKRSHRRAT